VEDAEEEDVIFDQWGATTTRTRNPSFASGFLKHLRNEENSPQETQKLALRSSNDDWFGSNIWGSKSKLISSTLRDDGDNKTWFPEDTAEHRTRESWELDMERKIIENLGIDFLDEPFMSSDRVQVHSSADLDQRAKSLPKLLEMGFFPSLCIQALENFDGDVDLARSWLISSRIKEPCTKTPMELDNSQNGSQEPWSWALDMEDKEELMLREMEDKSWLEWEQKHRAMLENNVHVKVDKSLPVSAVPCKFYLSGFCKNGDKCPFLHEEKNETEDKPKKAIPTPCKFFASGTCRKGDKCPFVHEQDKTAPTNWPANYKVTYIDGKTKKKIDQNGKKEVIESQEKFKGITIITRPTSLSSSGEVVDESKKEARTERAEAEAVRVDEEKRKCVSI